MSTGEKQTATATEYAAAVEEVALVVSETDDTSLPVMTFRAWTLGMGSCVLLVFLNTFFIYRTQPLAISAILMQITVLPIGKFMAATLPTKEYKLLGRSFSLNPGPFNMKEHRLGYDIISQFIFGYVLPRKPIANLLFKIYGRISTVHALSFLSDLKLGHYMKIPPRCMFVAQFLGNLVDGTVNLAVSWWMLKNIDNLCDIDGLHPESPWTCPKFKVKFDGSVIWGLIGPQRLFGPGVTTHLVTIFSTQPNMLQESLLIPLFFLFIFFLIKKHRQKNLLPPGPPKLPLIGNMNHLLHPAPHRALNNLAVKYGPIMHLKLGSISTIVVSSAEAARQIMKTHDSIFCNRPKLVAPKILGYNYSDIAFAPYGPYWRQLKKICVLELSTTKSMDASRFIREEEVRRVVESISKSCEPINLVERLFALNHNVISRITFGDSDRFDDELRFRLAIREGTALAAGFQIGDFFPSLGFVAKFTGMNRRMEECRVELSEIMDKKIQHHIDRGKLETTERECLVDVLLRLQEAGGELEEPLTTDNIKSILMDVFTGASENSSNIVEWAMAEMLKTPNMMKKAQTEIREVIRKKVNPTIEETDLPELNYMKMVIKETLRFHPPVPLLLPRESMERCMINGYEIPSQTRVLVNYWAIARDPVSWKDPNIFNPERFQDETKDYRGHDFEYIPFGAGRRACPGISLGMTNTELSLASLLYHFDWKLAGDEKPQDLDMNETFGMTCYKTCSLRLVPSLRFPISNY
ncbi:hypothetical protein SSX86_013048 [Deinandra increscens subsp. villosa]|uniref:Cytochrome P450 n=1 Tax=Deinandra increscens subsp. villosa TaxID=3103831 RepID=A0AAP0D9V5_9ASTR